MRPIYIWTKSVTLSVLYNHESRRCWWRRSISPKADVTTTAALLASVRRKLLLDGISERDCRAVSNVVC